MSENSSKNDNFNSLEKYKITLDFLKFEANTLWQIFNAFFIGNSIFATSIAILISIEHERYTIILILGIAGITITFLWLQSFLRNSAWYAYRMKQAKIDEENLSKENNDSTWFLLNKDAKEFADGPEIGGMKNNDAAKLMIYIFGTLYLILIGWSIVKINCI